jgi:hypothetical protein
LEIRLYGAGSQGVYYDNLQVDEGDATPFGTVPEAAYTARRNAISNAEIGWAAGNKASIQAAAQSVLSGTKWCNVYDHSTNTGAIGSGGQWDVLIVTKPGEAPGGGSAAIIQAVVDANAKPAGVKLWHREYVATWAQVEAAYANWAAINGKTWAQIQQTGLT